MCRASHNALANHNYNIMANYPKPQVGQYHYVLRGKLYVIYRYESISEHGSCSSPTDESFDNRDDARRRVYELNGWKLK